MNQSGKKRKLKLSVTPKFYRIMIYIIASLSLILGLLRYWEGPVAYNQDWDEFYTNIHAELIGMGLSVILFNGISQLAQSEAEKLQILDRLGSPSHDFAVEAYRQCVRNKWLYDGSLRGKLLYGANLKGVDLSNADIGETNLVYAHFEDSLLTEAKLDGSYLMGAHLNGADLCGADLRKSLLMDADLSGVIFDDETKWQGARFNFNTKWPENFDPIKEGCFLLQFI